MLRTGGADARHASSVGLRAVVPPDRVRHPGAGPSLGPVVEERGDRVDHRGRGVGRGGEAIMRGRGVAARSSSWWCPTARTAGAQGASVDVERLVGGEHGGVRRHLCRRRAVRSATPGRAPGRLTSPANLSIPAEAVENASARSEGTGGPTPAFELGAKNPARRHPLRGPETARSSPPEPSRGRSHRSANQRRALREFGRRAGTGIGPARPKRDWGTQTLCSRELATAATLPANPRRCWATGRLETQPPRGCSPRGGQVRPSAGGWLLKGGENPNCGVSESSGCAMPWAVGGGGQSTLQTPCHAADQVIT